VRRLLFRLELLLLPFVLLLELLGLLLVLLLCLLLSRFVSLLLFQLLMLPVLLLLELLSLLVLLSEELLLLLLVLLVQLRVSRVRGRQRAVLRKFVRMNGRVGTRAIAFRTRNWRGALWLSCRAIGWRPIWPSGLCGRDYCPVLKCAGFGSRRYRRLTLVHRSSQLRVGAGGLHMFSLSRHGRNMFLPRSSLLRSGRTRVDPTIAAVITNAIHRRIIDHCRVVDVVNVGSVSV
jgi:hypothetical protein